MNLIEQLAQQLQQVIQTLALYENNAQTAEEDELNNIREQGAQLSQQLDSIEKQIKEIERLRLEVTKAAEAIVQAIDVNNGKAKRWLITQKWSQKTTQEVSNAAANMQVAASFLKLDTAVIENIGRLSSTVTTSADANQRGQALQDLLNKCKSIIELLHGGEEILTEEIVEEAKEVPEKTSAEAFESAEAAAKLQQINEVNDKAKTLAEQAASLQELSNQLTAKKINPKLLLTLRDRIVNACNDWESERKKPRPDVRRYNKIMPKLLSQSGQYLQIAKEKLKEEVKEAKKPETTTPAEIPSALGPPIPSETPIWKFISAVVSAGLKEKMQARITELERLDKEIEQAGKEQPPDNEKIGNLLIEAEKRLNEGKIQYEQVAGKPYPEEPTPAYSFTGDQSQMSIPGVGPSTQEDARKALGSVSQEWSEVTKKEAEALPAEATTDAPKKLASQLLESTEVLLTQFQEVTPAEEVEETYKKYYKYLVSLQKHLAAVEAMVEDSEQRKKQEEKIEKQNYVIQDMLSKILKFIREVGNPPENASQETRQSELAIKRTREGRSEQLRKLKEANTEHVRNAAELLNKVTNLKNKL